MNRRTFLHCASAATVTSMAARPAPAQTDPHPAPPADGAPRPQRLLFAVKFGMVQTGGSVAERFGVLKELGYDGVELSSPGGPDPAEVRAAFETTGLPVHGVVDAVHWQQRLSDPDPAIRAAGRAALENAIRDAKAYGASSVLLVPGRVTDPQHENQQQVWDRSVKEIRAVLPLAAELGIHVLIENVWNGFCYEHDGPADQGADALAAYIDAIDSPWVGAYFDIGNHRRYGAPEQWIRTLGRRIVKCDVKDWGRTAGWAPIGEGDVDWPLVRAALADIGFTGWCTAEVGGGDEQRLADILARMERGLGPRD